jgi:SecD/SecF fusion protein
MKNQGIVVFLTIIITLLCIYYLSFTFVSRSVQHKANVAATLPNGAIDFAKKQSYLDSVWNEPVYSLLGARYTYKEIKETELGLGLDLQGGMHVTLEVSPVDIILGLSGNSEDSDFREALKRASEMQRSSQQSFIDLFYSQFREINPDRKLADIFATAANQGRISFDSSDDAVLRVMQEEIDRAIDRSFNILRTRVDRFGTSQPNIQRLQGTGRIQIELPGVENQERVRKLLQGVAKLEFWEVADFYSEDLAGPLSVINNRLSEEERLLALGGGGTSSAQPGATSGAQDDLARLLQAEGDTTATTDVADTTGAASGLDSLMNTQSSEFFSMIRFPQGLVNLKDTVKVNRILARLMGGDLRGILPGNIKFLWDAHMTTMEDGTEVLPLYAIRVGRNGVAPLTGEVITLASQSFDERTAPAVSMSMNAEGARVWRRLTAENVGRRVAIALDNYVYSAPMVQVEIPNGQSIITGNFTLEEAQDLANVLQAGALPARTLIVEEAVIGPTLGREAQKQGVFSMIAGLGIVVLFMIFYYARSGLVANIALVFNIFFILGILAQLNAALTLPGIAGIVLTIGMAVDANVLIFERIREEIRNGAALLNAISSGYNKAYSSIVDANVTTFLIGIILYTLGQGPVKGFAIVLMIGIASSFFTAVFISRVIITWMTRRAGDKTKISFSLPWSTNILANMNWKFMGKRKIAYVGSAIYISLGMIVLALQGGLNMGVDFTGGRAYVVGFEMPQVPSELKVALGNTFQAAGTEVKTYGANNVLKITTSYMINDESTEADEQVLATLIEGLESATGLKHAEFSAQIDAERFSILSTSKVGATIADDIKMASIESVLFSLIAIFIYILIRFKRWQFSLGAVVALLHDVLAVVATFAFARMFGKAFEVDQVIVAALLTVIGYSINDTVVVFDRIRENLAVRPHEHIEDTFNLSINTTLNRTLITSFTTLVVVFTLLLFGGEVLRGFSFSIFVGILIGTYSSIYVAAPIVIDFGRKKYALKGAS